MARAQKPHKIPKVSIAFHLRGGTKLVVLLAILAITLYSGVNIIQHARFETYMYDLGLVDQVLWKVSRLYAPQSTVFNFPAFFWNRHLDLTFYFLAPFYFLWRDVRMYLILEPLIVALGVFPIYFFARKRLGKILALGVSFSYLFSLGVQYALDYPGHADVRLTTFLAFLFYFLFRRNHKPVYVMALLCLFTKESAAFYLVFLGLFAIFVLKEKRLGATLIAFSLLFLVLVSGYLTSPLCPFWSWYEHLGQGPWEILGSLVFHPLRTLGLLVSPVIKFQTVFWLLFSFGFLPLLSPSLLLLSLPMFLERFLSNRPELWGLGLHYNILTAPVFVFAAIFGLEKLKRFLRIKNKILVIPLTCYLVVCTLGTTFLHKTFLTRIFDAEFYRFPAYLAATKKMIGQIPKHAILEAQEDLFSHLSHRDKIYPLGEGGAVEFIALDVNLFTAREGGKDKYIKRLLEDQNYGLAFCEEGAVLFERGKRDKVKLCPRVREFLTKLDKV